MGREAHFVRKSKWVLLFLSLFACVFGSACALSALSASATPIEANAVANYTCSYDPTVVFDFEDASAHRTSGQNSYSSTPNVYYQDGVTISLTYADSVTTGTPLSGSANVSARLSAGETSGPEIKIGPVDLSDCDKIKGLGYKCEGNNALTTESSYSTDNSSWTTIESHTGPSSQNTYGRDLDIAGVSTFYVKITVTAASSTKSNRFTYFDDITIYTDSSYISPATVYYSDATEAGLLASKGGHELADDIHTLMWSTTATRPAYNSLATYLPVTDANPTDADYLLDFWTGEPLLAETGNNIWNKEHVWPAANSNGAWQRLPGTDKSKKYGGSDLHHIRPSSTTLNISRGNGALGIVDTSKDYSRVVINGVTTGCLDGLNASGTKVFEPGDNRKGDIARIFFYLYITYSNTVHIDGTDYDLTAYDADTNYGNYVANLTDIIVRSSALIDASGTEYTSPIEMLLDWNEMDPVDEFEANRNEEVAKVQGNRNPFIDFPEIANFIFKGGSFYGITMDETQTILDTDDFFPTARTMPTDAAVTYTTSDSSIISISGSKFTVVGTGIVRITGTMTHNAITYTAATTVSVVTQVTDIVLSTDSYTLPSGMTFTPNAYCVPSNAYNRKITWSSDDEDVAIVDATTGKITAVATPETATTCNIIATADADDTVTATLALTVLVDSSTSGAIDIEIDSFGSATGTYTELTWNSGAYSGTGKVAKSGGMQLSGSAKSYVFNTTAFETTISQIIFYSSSTNSASEVDYDLYLGNTAAITDVSQLSSDATVTVGTYGATGSWTNASGANYTYFRINTKGTKTHYLSRIRIILGEYSKTLESLSVDQVSMKRSYNAGEALSLAGLSVTAHYDDGTSEVLDLADPSCTVAPANGTILSTSNDCVTIEYSSMTASVAIAVAGAKTLSSVSLIPSSAITIYQGYTRSLKAVATYSDGSKMTVTTQATWTSSSTTYASISSSGVLTGVAIGSATVTASYSYLGVTRSSNVGVTISAPPAFEVTLTSSDCVFGNSSYTPTFEATFGGDDVTSECSASPSFSTAGVYTFYESLGEHLFTIRYADGNVEFTSTLSIRTTNVGATNTVGSTVYSLVTNTAELAPGDTYIIANASELVVDETKVLSTTQNSNNRAEVAYSALGTGIQSLTLGGEDGAWTLYTGSGYLFAAGATSNNYLRTRSDNSDGNSQWDISFTEDGAATIVAQGTSTHNVMRYNSSSGSTLFSCYMAENTMKDVYLFKSRTSTFTPNEQAYAMKTYLDGLRTCDVTSEADVKRLALEYNTLNCTTVNATTAKAVFAGLYTAAQYEYGVDYVNGEYVANTPTGDAIPCIDKIRYIVATWNVNHPDDLVYLYTNAYYAGTDGNGSGSKETPSYAYDVYSVRQKNESSPLTITLWIVLGSGSVGIGLILGAYLVSKKKKKHRA